MGGLFVLIGVVFVLFLLFFPISLEADFYYHAKDKKIAFVLYAFRRFKVIGGYLDSYPGGFALHTSEKNAVLFPFQDREGRKRRMSIFRRFKLSKLAVTTETGADYLPLVAILHAFFKGYFLWQGGAFRNYQSQVWLRGGDHFSLTASGEAKITIYMQICAFLRKFNQLIIYVLTNFTQWQTRQCLTFNPTGHVSPAKCSSPQDLRHILV